MTNTSAYDENELFPAVASGDEQAFRQLFTYWQPFLSDHIHRLTESPELTEEIVHDVFLKIWQSRETLEEVRSFKAYLLVMSRNHALNALQKKAREAVSLQQYEKDFSVLQQDDPKKYYYSLIDEAIDQLSPRQKEVYLLIRHQRMTYQQAAASLGIGRESVKSHLENAVKHISRFVKSRITLLVFPWMLF